ncbi:HAD family hydrolase [Cryomorphaceae bacterium]|nr:HAD family hydrolase [Cryomorphaceae bacterium]
MNKAIFLDRDGVINHDPGDYTTSWDEFTFLPGIEEFLIKRINEGYLLILITNQGGVAKGRYTLETVEDIHMRMQEHLADYGIHFAEIYFSPYHDDYSRSLSRKPGSIMVEKALARFNIDPVQSVMIGDKQRDLDCAVAAGVSGHLVPVNSNLNEILSDDQF